MLGELEYDDLFKNSDECGNNDVSNTNIQPVLYPITSHILVAIFVLFVAMVLMNVLFGLAVADIQVSTGTPLFSRIFGGMKNP